MKTLLLFWSLPKILLILSFLKSLKLVLSVTLRPLKESLKLLFLTLAVFFTWA